MASSASASTRSPRRSGFAVASRAGGSHGAVRLAGGGSTVDMTTGTVEQDHSGERSSTGRILQHLMDFAFMADLRLDDGSVGNADLADRVLGTGGDVVGEVDVGAPDLVSEGSAVGLG